jgi:hypothetical protein
MRWFDFMAEDVRVSIPETQIRCFERLVDMPTVYWTDGTKTKWPFVSAVLFRETPSTDCWEIATRIAQKKEARKALGQGANMQGRATV